MPTLLLTGANRGLGLEFVRQYAEDGWRVHACCRDPARAEALAKLAADHGEVQVHRLDVTDEGQIGALTGAIGGEPIDILLNNAGVMGPRGDAASAGANQSLRSMDYAGWAETMAVNALAPFRMAQAFLDNVGAGSEKKIFTMTSRMGSITEGGGGYYAYRSSKAAVNAVMKNMATELAHRGITVAVFHPGWAQTAMGGPSATLPVTDSVGGLRTLFASLTTSESGRFYLYDGSDIPW